jgi:hypothetical protein
MKSGRTTTYAEQLATVEGIEIWEGKRLVDSVRRQTRQIRQRTIECGGQSCAAPKQKRPRAPIAGSLLTLLDGNPVMGGWSRLSSHQRSNKAHVHENQKRTNGSGSQAATFGGLGEKRISFDYLLS